MDKYDRTLKLQDYKDLANAQAGALDRYNEDDMARVGHLFEKGYIAIADARFVILTEAGYDCLAAVKFERYNQKEWFENYPQMLDTME
tara:strand:- start:282 stop:545 length:264 start_codon:yes stop_codon:yes gene_type:complete